MNHIAFLFRCRIPFVASIILTLVLGTGRLSQAEEPNGFRVWRSADSSRSQEGRLDSVVDGHVYVILRDGTRARLPISALSKEDQRYLEQNATVPELFERLNPDPAVTTKRRVANKPLVDDAGLLDTRPLPAEFRVLANELGMEMHLSPNDFVELDGAAIIAECHEALANLRSVKSADPEITALAGATVKHLEEVLGYMDRIEKLPKPPSALETFGQSLLAGALTGDPIMGALAGGSVGAAADAKTKAIMNELEGMVQVLIKLDAAHASLARIAKRYSAALVVPKDRVSIDIDESWGIYGPNDWLCLRNNGPDLKDCTIQVELFGVDAKRTNVHYVADWPAGKWLYARYKPGDELNGKPVGRETVLGIQKAKVLVLSPDFSTSLDYTYAGENLDKDIAERVKNATFTGEYRQFEKGMWWDTQRGYYVTMKGMTLPQCRVDVNFMKNGQKVKGWFWSCDSWSDGERKLFESPSGGLTVDPDDVEMVISFPNSSHQIKHTWRR